MHIPTDSVRLGRVAENVAFNVLLNGSHMLWQYEELGYDFSINSDVDHPNGNKSDYRCNKKPRPEKYGYFDDANRLAAYEKCAQVIRLRTELMPNVFAGNPSAQSIGGGVKLRSIRWGNDVYAVANFDTISVQTATLPSGTWYDYFGGATLAAASYQLHPGELKIFTGSPIALPVIDTNIVRTLPIENIPDEETKKAMKFFRNGQIFIRRGDKTYTITGMEVR